MIRRVRRGGQGVGVGAIRIELDLAILAGGVTDQGEGQPAHATADGTGQRTAGRLAGGTRFTAGNIATGQIVAILVQIKCFLVDRDLAVRPGDQRAIAHVDGNGGGAFVAITVTHGIDEDIRGARRRHGIGVGVIGGVALGIEGQVTVLALDRIAQLATGRCRGVGAGSHTHHVTTIGPYVRARRIVVEHVAADRAAFDDTGRIGIGLGQVVDDVHVQRTSGRAAIGVRGGDSEMLGQAVGAVAVGVALVVQQGVAVADHTRGRVVTGDGQGVAQRSGDRLRETCRHAATDHGDAADVQGLQAIGRRHREGAALRQRIGIGCTAVGQVLLVDGQLAAFDVQPAEGHRVIEVADVEGQGRRAGVAVGVFQGVGKVFHPTAATVQILEVRIVGIEGVGVGTIRRQHQGAVGANEGTGHHRAAGDAVRALDIVGQHIAAEFQMLLGGGGGIAVIHSPGHIVTNDNVQRAAGHIAIGVADQHRELLAQCIGPGTVRMMFRAGQGVAVAHHARGRVVARDGQHIAEPGDDGLADAGHHASGDHVDATDTEVEHAIGGNHREAARLGQGQRVAGRALGQVRLVQAQLGRADIQAGEADRIVSGWRAGRQGRRVIAIEPTKLEVGQQREAVEARRRETDGGIHPTGHLGQYHETVAATERTRHATRVAARRGRFGFLRGVGACGNGFLQLLDVTELGVAGLRVRRLYMRSAIGQQVGGHLQAAATAQGQLGTVLQAHRHRALASGLQLLAGEQAIPFHQQAAMTVIAHREYLADYLADHTD